MGLIHCIFKESGATMSKSLLQECWDLISNCNPWFPEKGTLDPRVWGQVTENIGQIHRQGERILAQL